MDDLISLYWNEQAAIAEQMKEQTENIALLVEMIIDAYEQDARVFTMANGGGASAAEGFAVDLKTHPFVSDDKKRTSWSYPKLEVHCLNESCGLITGISNDLGYEEIFVEQLKNYVLQPEDLIIGFSGSGNSANILKAFKYASDYGARTVCISGRGGGRAARKVELSIVIPGTSTFPGQTGGNDNNFHIEDCQVSISHIVTGLLKERIQNG